MIENDYTRRTPKTSVSEAIRIHQAQLGKRKIQ